MSTAAKVVQQKTFTNPLEGGAGIVVFLAIVLSLVAVDFVVCSAILPLDPPTKQLILQLFIIVIGLGWYAFTIASEVGDFFVYWLFLAMGCGAPVALVLTQNLYTFWASLVIVDIFAIFIVAGNKTGAWEKFIVSIYALWVVTGAIITLGSTDYFPYAKPAADLKEVHNFLDVRLIITVFLLFIFIIKAIWQAIRKGRPDIPSIPDFTIPDIPRQQVSILATAFRPFVIVINGLLKILQVLTDILWKLLAAAGTYLGRFGANLANQVFDLISQGGVWFDIIRVLLTFFLVIGFSYGAILVSPQVATYLTTDAPFSSISWDAPVTLALKYTIGFFFLSLIGILITCWMWQLDEFAMQTIFSGSIIIVTCALAGGIMYAAARINYLSISGFSALGVFSLLILIVIVAVFFVQIFKRIANKAA